MSNFLHWCFSTLWSIIVGTFHIVWNAICWVIKVLVDGIQKVVVFIFDQYVAMFRELFVFHPIVLLSCCIAGIAIFYGWSFIDRKRMTSNPKPSPFVRVLLIVVMIPLFASVIGASISNASVDNSIKTGDIRTGDGSPVSFTKEEKKEADNHAVLVAVISAAAVIGAAVIGVKWSKNKKK